MVSSITETLDTCSPLCNACNKCVADCAVKLNNIRGALGRAVFNLHKALYYLTSFHGIMDL